MEYKLTVGEDSFLKAFLERDTWFLNQADLKGEVVVYITSLTFSFSFSVFLSFAFLLLLSPIGCTIISNLFSTYLSVSLFLFLSHSFISIVVAQFLPRTFSFCLFLYLTNFIPPLSVLSLSHIGFERAGVIDYSLSLSNFLSLYLSPSPHLFL